MCIFEIDNAAFYDDFPWFCFLHWEKDGRKLVVAKNSKVNFCGENIIKYRVVTVSHSTARTRFARLFSGPHLCSRTWKFQSHSSVHPAAANLFSRDDRSRRSVQHSMQTVAKAIAESGISSIMRLAWTEAVMSESELGGRFGQPGSSLQGCCHEQGHSKSHC
jgi:hypothetical protein